MRLALYQPDIPQNTGAVMRTAACLGTALHIIEPCGFVLSDARMRRSGMDYLDHLEMRRHASWAAFREASEGRRLVLLTTAAAGRPAAKKSGARRRRSSSIRRHAPASGAPRRRRIRSPAANRAGRRSGTRRFRSI